MPRFTHPRPSVGRTRCGTWYGAASSVWRARAANYSSSGGVRASRGATGPPRALACVAFYAAAAGRRWLRRGGCGISSPGRRLAARLACAPAHRPVACPLASHVSCLSMGLGFAAASACQDGGSRPASPAPRPAARWFAIGPPRRWLPHWLWHCCACLCRPGLVRQPEEWLFAGLACPRRPGPSRHGSRASRPLHRTIQ